MADRGAFNQSFGSFSALDEPSAISPIGQVPTSSSTVLRSDFNETSNNEGTTAAEGPVPTKSLALPEQQKRLRALNFNDMHKVPSMRQLVFFLQNYTRKRTRNSQAELMGISARMDVIGLTQVIRILFGNFVKPNQDPSRYTKEFFQTFPISFMVNEIINWFDRIGFKTGLLWSVEMPMYVQGWQNFLGFTQGQAHQIVPITQILARTAKLNKEQELRFCVMLLDSTIDPIPERASEFIAEKLPEILRYFIQADERLLMETDHRVYHMILQTMEPGRERTLACNVPNDLRQEFIDTLKKTFLSMQSKVFPLHLKPMIEPMYDLYKQSGTMIPDKYYTECCPVDPFYESNTTLSDLLFERSPDVLKDLPAIREILHSLPPCMVTPESVARALALVAGCHVWIGAPASMARFALKGNSRSAETTRIYPVIDEIRSLNCFDAAGIRAGVDTSTIPERMNFLASEFDWLTAGRSEVKSTEEAQEMMTNLVCAIVELAPRLRWQEVVYELDHEGFWVPDRASLFLLLHGLILGLRQTTFPVELFYRHWAHNASQLSFFVQALRNPSLFDFASFTGQGEVCRLDNTIKNISDRLHARQHLRCWQIMDLVETLLFLGDNGFKEEVLELFYEPMCFLPDLLCMVLMQLGGSCGMHTLRHEISRSCFQRVVAQQLNHFQVISFAWGCTTNNYVYRQIFIDAMAEWYLFGGCNQAKLTRVLDITQDLKCLGDVLNADILPFVIDLAVIASRRDYLKLDKWMEEKIKEYKHVMVGAIVKFLSRRSPSLTHGDQTLDDEIPLPMQLPSEVVAKTLNALQRCLAPQFSRHYIEHVMVLLKNYPAVLARPYAPANTYVGRQGVTMPHSNLPEAAVPFGSSPPPNIHSPDGIEKFMSSAAAAINNFSNNSGDGKNFTTGVVPADWSLPAAGGDQSIPANANAANSNAFGDSSKMSNASGNMFSQQGGKHGSGDASANEKRFSSEIEDETLEFFNEIFHNTLSIEEAVHKVAQWQNVNNPRNATGRERYLCMLKYIIDELKYIESFPEKEMDCIGRFLGSLLGANLLHPPAVQTTLFFTLKNLTSDTDARMFRFCVTVLKGGIHRIREWSMFADKAVQCTGYSRLPDELKDVIEAVAGQPKQTVPSKPTFVNGGVSMQLQEVRSSRLKCFIEWFPSSPSPPKDTQEKLFFICNNLSETNTKEKAKEFMELFGDNISAGATKITESMNEKLKSTPRKYWGWVAHYLVNKRIASEPNYHLPYMEVFSYLNYEIFYALLKRETVKSCKKILRSTDKNVGKFDDRTMLKNLGHFLGLITIGRNKPILSRDLDIKSLLVEAFHKGASELHFVLPFAAKIMESIKRSTLFNKSNPWTRRILELMSAIYHNDVKLNLKFEVEVLSQILGISIANMQQSSVLHDAAFFELLLQNNQQLGAAHGENEVAAIKAMTDDAKTAAAIAGQHSAQNLNKSPTQSAGPTPTPSTPRAQSSAQSESYAAVQPAQLVWSYNEVECRTTTWLVKKVHVNPSIIPYFSRPEVRRAIMAAIDRFGSENVAQIAERVVNVALPAAEVLVKKDFGLDSDENRMKVAASLIARYFSAGIAYAIGRELAVTGLQNCIWQALSAIIQRPNSQPPTKHDKEAISKIAETFAKENTGLIMVYVQKSAAERAIKLLIEDRLHSDFVLRNRSRVEGGHYADPVEALVQTQRMPEGLRLQIAGAPPADQSKVYELFRLKVPGFRAEDEPPPPRIAAPGDESNIISQMLDSVIAKLTGILTVMAAMRSGVTVSSNTKSAGSSTTPGQTNTTTPSTPGAVGSVVVSHATAAADQHVAIVSDLREVIKNTRDATPRTPDMIIHCVNKSVVSLFDGLLHFSKMGMMTAESEFVERFRQGALAPLQCFQDPKAFGSSWVSSQVTKAVVSHLDEGKYSLEALDTLFKTRMVIPGSLDKYFVLRITAKEEQPTDAYMEFITAFLHRFFVRDSLQSHIQESEFVHTIFTVTKWASEQKQLPVNLLQILDQVKLNIVPDITVNKDFAAAAGVQSPDSIVAAVHWGILAAKDTSDPIGFREKVEGLVGEWVKLCNQPTVKEALGLLDRATPTDWAKDLFRRLFQNLISHGPIAKLFQIGLLKTEDFLCRFVRVGLEAMLEMANRVANETPSMPIFQNAARQKVYFPVDCFAYLIAFIMRQYPHDLCLFSYKVFGILGGKMLHETEFREAPLTMHVYARILSTYYLSMLSPFLEFDKRHTALTLAYINTLHAIRPQKAPAFTFSWINLICEKDFVHRVLVKERCNRKAILRPGVPLEAPNFTLPLISTWDAYCNLLIDLLNFLYPFARNITLSRGAIMLFRICLRIFVLFHRDFPDFLAYYYAVLSDVIPTSSVQLRNVLLSAGINEFPFVIDYSEYRKYADETKMSQIPVFRNKFSIYLQPESFKTNLDSYLETRAPVQFHGDLESQIMAGSSSPKGHRYNVCKLNSLVLYVGHRAVKYFQKNNIQISALSVAHSSHMDIIQNLAMSLDNEGRYLLIHAVATHLRYPNAHTHYFQCVMMHLFRDTHNEHLQEIIARVLVERIISHPPHPWGLIATCGEIFCSPESAFWKHDFAFCHPEVTRMFDTITRQYGVTRQAVSARTAAAPGATATETAASPENRSSASPSPVQANQSVFAQSHNSLR